MQIKQQTWPQHTQRDKPGDEIKAKIQVTLVKVGQRMQSEDSW